MNRANQWWLVAVVAWASAHSPGSAASINWRNDVDQARGEAVQSGKLLLIKVSTDWCRYCRKMELETFSAPEIVDHVNMHYIPLRLDADRDRELAGRLGVHRYPITILASPDLNILSKVDGFRTPRQLQRHLRSQPGGDLNALRKTPRPPGTSFHSSFATRIRESRPVPGSNQGIPTGTGQLSVFGNYCPVSSITRGQFVEGNPAFPLQHRGYDLRFASYAAREQFVSNQRLFWPVGNGLCAVSVLDHGTVRWGTWPHSLRFAGLIWMFASEEHKNQFLARPEQYMQRRFNVVDSSRTTIGPQSNSSTFEPILFTLPREGREERAARGIGLTSATEE